MNDAVAAENKTFCFVLAFFLPDVRISPRRVSNASLQGGWKDLTHFLCLQYEYPFDLIYFHQIFLPSRLGGAGLPFEKCRLM